NAVKLQTRNVSALAPTSSQVLRWNSLGSQWEPSNDTSGTVTSILASTGLTGGTISATGTIAVDVGTQANKIVQLDGSARLPAVDAGLLSNVNASKLQGKPVSAASPVGGQVLAWNSTNADWEPTAAGGIGTVTNVTGGTGLTGGSFSSSGT